METFVDRCIELRDGVMASRTTHQMHPQRVIISRDSTVVAAVVVVVLIAVVAAAAVGAFGSLLLGHLC
jgi:nitrate reductase NapE component